MTICTAGKTAGQIAAEQLAARGLQAFSLGGGMRAWIAAGYPLQFDEQDDVLNTQTMAVDE